VSSAAPVRRSLILLTPQADDLARVDEQAVRGKITEPRGCEENPTFFAPWLK
jgi:hypothetical protein